MRVVKRRALLIKRRVAFRMKLSSRILRFHYQARCYSGANTDVQQGHSAPGSEDSGLHRITLGAPKDREYFILSCNDGIEESATGPGPPKDRPASPIGSRRTLRASGE